MITTYNSRKHYGSLVAVKDVNLTLKRGEVLGLVAPNGAEKTTLLKIINASNLPIFAMLFLLCSVPTLILILRSGYGLTLIFIHFVTFALFASIIYIYYTTWKRCDDAYVIQKVADNFRENQSGRKNEQT